MQNEKKIYETPVVTKVEYDASDRITSSYCFDGDVTTEDNWCDLYD